MKCGIPSRSGLFFSAAAPAGAAGMLLSVFFQRAERGISAGLLAWHLACPVPKNAGDCPLDRDKTACYSVFDLKRL